MTRTWRGMAAFVVLAMVLALIVPCTGVIAEDEWELRWPPGLPTSDITAIAVAPSDGQTIYVATASAVYCGTDSGGSWAPLGDLNNVVALAVDPTNRDIVYAACWPSQSGALNETRGLRKSTDGGQTWSDPTGGASPDLLGPVGVIAVSPADPQVVLVGTASTGISGRILRSADGGQTWQVTYAASFGAQPAGVVGIVVHPRDHKVVYAAHTVYHGGMLLVSNDGGLSWRPFDGPQLPLSGPAAIAVDPLDTNIIYVAYQAPMGAGVHVFRASYAGGPWTELAEGLLIDGTSRPYLVVDPSDQRVLYLSLHGDTGGIFRTTNRGDSWSKLTPDSDPHFRGVTALGYSATERVLYAGTREGVWQRKVLPAIADSLVQYYDAHDGWRVLGRPCSPPVRIGQLAAQYFEKARLEDHSLQVSDPNWKFMYGLLVDELQAARSSLPVGGEVSTISYANINDQASPGQRVPAPAGFTGGVHVNADGSVFVPYDAQLQSAPGHNVPTMFWQYINRGDLFPGGWLHDIGLPMTEPTLAVVDKGDIKGRQIWVQAFQRTVLTYDPANPAEWQVERANTGSDYLKQFGAK